MIGVTFTTLMWNNEGTYNNIKSFRMTRGLAGTKIVEAQQQY